MVGFRNLVGTGIAPVSTKTAVKSLSLTLALVKSSMCSGGADADSAHPLLLASPNFFTFRHENIKTGVSREIIFQK